MSRPSPVGAVIRGAIAGTAGTAAMDLFWYLRQRISGEPPHRSDSDLPGQAGRASLRPASWEDSEHWTAETQAEEWQTAPVPAQVGKRVYEGLTQRTLEARFARITGTLVHWSYGMWWGGVFGLASAPLRRRTVWGPLFGATVWGSSYLLLPVTGLYRPFWEYPLAELAPDLAAHLIYGTGTALAFATVMRRRSSTPPGR